MIVEYHRPTQINDALSLLGRENPRTIPIGGGSAFERLGPEPIAVMDLQALGLNFFRVSGNTLELGAALTLQNLIDEISVLDSGLLPALVQVITLEATYNLRQVGSVAGTLISADGRSSFATAMLALDATLTLEPGGQQLDLGDLLPVRATRLDRRLITSVHLPLNAHLGFEYVARSPADRPIVAAAAARWPSGRTRLALGGYGTAPVLAFDGMEADGVEIAASSAYTQADDQWASAAYRQEIAGICARRALQTALMSYD